MTSAARVKGNKSRLKAIRELEADGWLVDVVEKTSRWCKVKDCFALFDLLCLKPGQVMLLQISTNRPHTHWQLEEFAKKYKAENIYFTQWVWIDREGFKKFNYGVKE